MQLWRNASRVLQIVYSGTDPIHIPPGFCAPCYLPVSHLPGFERSPDLASLLRRKPDSCVVLVRSYAFGDILMLHSLLQSIKTLYPEAKFILATTDDLVPPFRHSTGVRVVPLRRIGSSTLRSDMGLVLDGILEVDHSGAPESYKHRIQIYSEYFGFPVLSVLREAA